MTALAYATAQESPAVPILGRAAADASKKWMFHWGYLGSEGCLTRPDDLAAVLLIFEQLAQTLF